MTPDGKTAILAQNNQLQFLDLFNGKVIRTIAKAGQVRVLLVDAAGEKLVGYGDRITLWQLKTGYREKQWIAGVGVADQPIALSPDGTLLVTYTTDGLVKVLRINPTQSS